jgi:antirestriction protein ArdC
MAGIGLFTHLRAMRFKCPILTNLKARQAYAGTLLHELGHATGGENRLNRPLGEGFGTSEYAREELVAELCSAFASAETGVPFDDKNHAAYIGSWLEVLKADKHAVFAAAKDASKAVDYLLEKSLGVEVDKDLGRVADEVAVEPVKEDVQKPSKARTKKVAKPEAELEI